MDQDRNNWGRIVNGAIKKRCIALSNGKVEDDTLSETSTDKLSDSITTPTKSDYSTSTCTKSDNSTNTCTPPLTTTSKDSKTKGVRKHQVVL